MDISFAPGTSELLLSGYEKTNPLILDGFYASYYSNMTLKSYNVWLGSNITASSVIKYPFLLLSAQSLDGRSGPVII